MRSRNVYAQQHGCHFAVPSEPRIGKPLPEAEEAPMTTGNLPAPAAHAFGKHL